MAVTVSNHNRTARITLARILPAFTSTQHDVRVVHGTPLGATVRHCGDYHITEFIGENAAAFRGKSISHDGQSLTIRRTGAVRVDSHCGSGGSHGGT